MKIQLVKNSTLGNVIKKVPETEACIAVHKSIYGPHQIIKDKILRGFLDQLLEMKIIAADPDTVYHVESDNANSYYFHFKEFDNINMKRWSMIMHIPTFAFVFSTLQRL